MTSRIEFRAPLADATGLASPASRGAEADLAALMGDPEALREFGSELPRLFEEFSRVTAELAASHDVLLGQVDALKRELAAKNEQLERKKRLEALGRVAAGVAHEFRNPLGGIRLTCDALVGHASDDATRDRLEHIRRAVSHLDHIVSDLLTFTRSDAVECSPLRVREVVDAAVELAFVDNAARLTDLVVSGDDRLEFELDRHAFIQVLVNLLTNACHATDECGGPIGISWGTREGVAWIEVADDGPGIPDGEEERIFHPFHSLRDGGTGLGLAIVHSRVEAHRGEIQIDREAWGGVGADWTGARFRIVLPLNPEERSGTSSTRAREESSS